VNLKLIPFLNWAGGKRWLAANHLEQFPKDYNRYIEPFLGSGAIFFALQPKHSILSDINSDLIQTYRAIQLYPQDVEDELKKHHDRHCKDYYYEMRSSTSSTIQEGAARFIYLNRTCWNGLYRVNLSGKFNVPIGTKKNVILSTDSFQEISKMLQSSELEFCDFESSINRAEDGDLLFVDPPYTVKHNNNAFVQYNEALFSWDDQVRLHRCLCAAKKRGAFVVATNAYHESIEKLYSYDFAPIIVNRHSGLSGDTSGRGYVEEFIFTNVKQE